MGFGSSPPKYTPPPAAPPAAAPPTLASSSVASSSAKQRNAMGAAANEGVATSAEGVPSGSVNRAITTLGGVS